MKINFKWKWIGPILPPEQSFLNLDENTSCLFPQWVKKMGKNGLFSQYC